METTARGAPFPDLTDAPDGPTQIGLLAVWVNDRPGVATLTYAQINALAGAELWAGRAVYQTDTGTARPEIGLYTFNGVSWRPSSWTEPWGEQITVTAGNDVTNYVGYADVAALATTFVAVANRRYRITVELAFTVSVSGSGATCRLMEGATQFQERSSGTDGNNNGSIHLEWKGTLSAGAHTVTPQLGHAATGTVNILASGPTKLSSVTVEDLGPAGIPT